METEGESTRDRETAQAARAVLGPRASVQKGAAAPRRPRSLGVEWGRDGAGCYFACTIGHVVGHLKDIGKAGARDRAASVSVLLLLGDGAVRVEAES